MKGAYALLANLFLKSKDCPIQYRSMISLVYMIIHFIPIDDALTKS